MDIFELMRKTNCKEILFFDEPSVALKAIVAMDNTVLGPAVGSCKIYEYDSTEAALQDALDIAFFNTFSAALMHRNMGGGSIIVCGDPKTIKSEMFFRALGIFLNKLNGKIFLTNASGVNQQDMIDVQRESKYILGLPEHIGGSGNTLVNTAKGLIWGLKAAMKEKYDTTELKGIKIAVHGVGDVGSALVEELIKEEADLTITDKIYDKIKVIQDKSPTVKVVKPAEIYKVKCNIFCVCSNNFVINNKNYEQLNCDILTGSADRILDHEDLSFELEKRNILYIPGFIINSGKIIQLSNEVLNYPTQKTDHELRDIYYTTLNILQLAKKQNRKIYDVAYDLAKKYIVNVSTIKMLK